MEEPASSPDPRELRTVVLVPTLDNVSDLQLCLEALSEQSWDHFKTVVVDSRPRDSTRKLVESLGAEYMPDESRSRASACNYALSKLECDVVLFTDDDCYPPPDWVKHMVLPYARPEVAGTGGTHIAPPDQGFWGKAVDVALAAPVMSIGLRYMKNFSGLQEIEHNPGCNAGYRKEVLDEVGGFADNPYGCEDVTLDQKITSLGYRLWFVPEAVTHHRRRDRVGPLAAQMFSYGRGRADANHRCPPIAKRIHALPSLVLLLLLADLCVALCAALTLAFVPSSSAGPFLMALVASPVLGLGLFYLVAALGAAKSASPYRSLATVLVSPPIMLLAIVHYGRGFLHWTFRIKPTL